MESHCVGVLQRRASLPVYEESIAAGFGQQAKR